MAGGNAGSGDDDREADGADTPVDEGTDGPTPDDAVDGTHDRVDMSMFDTQMASMTSRAETPPLGVEVVTFPDGSIVPPPPFVDPDRLRRTPDEPTLPNVPAQPSPSTQTVPTAAVTPPSRALHYRSDEERNRSVYRRANPWYRQLARGVVALTLIGGLGAAIYFGVGVAQNWFDRAKLPSAGAEVPAFRTTSFQIRSSAPAPALEGTLTIDTQTRAFEFIGGPTGAQSGRRVVSADGGVAYSLGASGRWTRLADSDPLDRDIRRAVRYLGDDSTADAILTNRLRRGYVDLIDEVDEGEGAAALTRYDMRFNTRAFALDFPLQWQDFEATAIPGVGESAALPVSIKLDTEDVLVAVTDEATGWRWQRLDYFDRAASIVNPAASLLDATTVQPEG